MKKQDFTHDQHRCISLLKEWAARSRISLPSIQPCHINSQRDSVMLEVNKTLSSDHSNPRNKLNLTNLILLAHEYSVDVQLQGNSSLSITIICTAKEKDNHPSLHDLARLAHSKLNALKEMEANAQGYAYLDKRSACRTRSHWVS